MNAPYNIRSAVAGDCASLETLVNSCYRGDSSRVGWTTEADYLDGLRIDHARLKADIERPGCVIYCLRERVEGPILACVFVQDFVREDGLEVYFGMLAVRPDLQARGFGRVLLEHLEAQARARGALRVTMRVIQIRDSLIAWYERRGYRRTGRLEAFPYGDDAFGVPRRDDLQFEWMEKTL
jgi:GNAT superfamily N-acetyltransferase